MDTWLMGACTFIYVLGTYLASIYEQATNANWLGHASVSTLQTLTSLRVITITNTGIGGLPTATWNPLWFDALFKVVLMRYEFMMANSWLQITWFFICLPIAVIAIATIGLTIYNLAQSLISMVTP